MDSVSPLGFYSKPPTKKVPSKKGDRPMFGVHVRFGERHSHGPKVSLREPFRKEYCLVSYRTFILAS